MRVRTPGAVVALLVLGLSFGAASGQAARSKTFHAGQLSGGLTYYGEAAGSRASVGSTVVSGWSALTGLSCTTPAGVHRRGTVATVNISGLATTGAINTSAQTLSLPNEIESRTIADIHDASLLSGLITLGEIKAQSATSEDATGFHVSAAGSSVLKLVVAGVPINALPAPNTTIVLPGVGKVVLNEQTKHEGANGAGFAVNMIHVYLTAGGPNGTEIVLGHATSGLTLTSRTASLNGAAYGSFASVGNLITSGQSWEVNLPCAGITGTLTNTAASTNIPGVLATGTVTDKATGTVGPTSSMGEDTSEVQKVNLLSSLVTVDAIKSDAHASNDPGGTTLSDAGSTFLNLAVNGHPISAEPAANTKIVIGNITIWLHRVIQSKVSITVRMIEITVSGPNPLGAAPGTDIQVGVAFTSAAPVVTPK